jgi:hypothetical protein
MKSSTTLEIMRSTTLERMKFNYSGDDEVVNYSGDNEINYFGEDEVQLLWRR